MGYFPNGTAGECYYDEWCSRCLHDANGTCPVWLAHLLHNYEECNNKDSILHLLIPRKDIENSKCRMFVDKGLLSNLALQKYKSDEAEAP